MCRTWIRSITVAGRTSRSPRVRFSRLARTPWQGLGLHRASADSEICTTRAVGDVSVPATSIEWSHFQGKTSGYRQSHAHRERGGAWALLETVPWIALGMEHHAELPRALMSRDVSVPSIPNAATYAFSSFNQLKPSTSEPPRRESLRIFRQTSHISRSSITARRPRSRRSIAWRQRRSTRVRWLS